VLADEIPQAIQWHEGMLLSPQHFQQSSWRQEMLVQYSMLLTAPMAGAFAGWRWTRSCFPGEPSGFWTWKPCCRTAH